MDYQVKINHLKNFLNTALAASDASRAQKNFEMAEQLLCEVECATLSNPNVTDQHIETIVGLSRGLLWEQVISHIQKLRKSEAVRLCA